MLFKYIFHIWHILLCGIIKFNLFCQTFFVPLSRLDLHCNHIPLYVRMLTKYFGHGMKMIVNEDDSINQQPYKPKHSLHNYSLLSSSNYEIKKWQRSHKIKYDTRYDHINMTLELLLLLYLAKFVSLYIYIYIYIYIMHN